MLLPTVGSILWLYNIAVMATRLICPCAGFSRANMKVHESLQCCYSILSSHITQFCKLQHFYHLSLLWIWNRGSWKWHLFQKQNHAHKESELVDMSVGIGQEERLDRKWWIKTKISWKMEVETWEHKHG